MKKISTLILGFLMIGSLQLSAQEDKSTRPSPPKTEKGNIGDVMVTIEYSSPSVKGREIFGGLISFDKIWRAGANEATTIEFSKDVTINGEELAAGKYAFFVTPKKEGDWTIIFNSQWEQWGAYKKDDAKDVLVTEASTSEIDNVEMLTYVVDENMIHLDWATTRLSFEVK
ncbi:MAG TPA: DUF2911 domain-containing protein [Vampirovibrionales bacterium]